MRRILAVVVGLLLAMLAACGSDAPSPGGGTSVCRADKDCDSGVCDPFRGCVDCRASSQCQSGQECLGGSCRLSQPCTSDQACSEGQHCDLGAQTCVDCLKQTDCADGSACVSGACQPASACHDAQGCRPGTVCDLAHGTCVECLGGADCAAGERCVDQSCRKACTDDGGCGAGLRCDPLLSLCMECVTSSDCAENRHCSAGRCALDVCVAGTGTCEPAGQAIQLCNAAGDRTVPLYCGKDANCAGEPGQAKCSDWVCTPGVSRCNAAGALETCAKDGLSVTTEDCAAADQICVDTKCVDIVCEPGAVTCDAATNILHTCSTNGTSESLTACSIGQYCDAEAKSCKLQVCVPKAQACIDNVPSVCNEAGSGYDPGKSCKADQVCVQGACQPRVCDPLDQYCGDDGNVYYCNGDGTASTQLAICESPDESGEAGQSGYDYHQHCEKHGSGAGCYSDPCAKGETYCELNRVKTCNAEGTGAVDAGEDCGADAVCQGYGPASCVPKICTPYTRFCDGDGNSVYCNSDGTSFSIYQYCGDGLYCDGADGYCKYELCTPSAPGCNGSVATTCKADGSDWATTGTDCALSSKVCEGGTCKTKICEPNQYFCKSGNPNLCNGTGTTGTVVDTCAADTYCSPGYWYCLADVCTAGQPFCADATHLATCKADGSGANGAGTSCGANKVCDAGQCKAQVCTPYSTFCQGGHVQACDSLGLTFSQLSYCFADQFCRTDSSTAASCQPKVCTTGAKGCNGESYGTCDALGSGYLDSPTNCAASDKVCSLTGCATSAVDEMGDQSDEAYASGDSLHGDVVYVRTTRKLTKIELDASTDTTGVSLHWAVYASAVEGGPYAPVFDTITTGNGAGFQSSGPISATLTAGKYYVIAFQAGSSFFVYRNDGLTAPVSFADPLGTMYQYATPGVLPLTISGASQPGTWNMRLTTVLP